MSDFDVVSFFIGVLVGVIVTIIFVWISYSTRMFLFTYCPRQARPCGATDYFNDPGNALAYNPNISVSDILFLNNNNEMFYKRVPRNTDCVPEYNQIVYIKYPQYCSFSTSGSLWKQTAFNSNIYKPVNGSGDPITTEGNCIPINSPITFGVPILKWDPNPIS